MPDKLSPASVALEHYARLFVTAERMQEQGGSPSAAAERELAAAAAVLDRVRPDGAEDLRIVLNADSDDRAQAFQSDAAQRSDLIARS